MENNNLAVKEKINIFKMFLIKLQENHSNSEIFWNGLLYIAYIILAFINIEIALCLSGIGSIIMLGALCDDAEKFKLWFPLTLVFYFCSIVAFVGIILFAIHTQTTEKFNNWLNKTK